MQINKLINEQYCFDLIKIIDFTDIYSIIKLENALMIISYSYQSIRFFQSKNLLYSLQTVY